MNRLLRFVVTTCAVVVALSACGSEGPMGPEGPQGPSGAEGPSGPAGPPGPGYDVDTFTGQSDGSTIVIDLRPYAPFDEPPLVFVYESVGTPGGISVRWTPSDNWSIEPIVPPDYLEAELHIDLPEGYWYYAFVLH